jgi:coenzyme F420-reducing hydrogenase delta subunit
MTFIPQARIDRIQARITILEAQQVAVDAAIVAGNEIGEYRFDSGEGSQRVRYKSLKELLETNYNLDRLIEHLYRKLQGTGIVNLNLRR